MLGKISTAVVLVLLGIGAAMAFTAFAPGLVPWSNKSTSESSLVVTALERTEEVSLLNLGVEGITESRTTKEVLGFTVPGSDKAKFIQYSFTLKLGLDGSQVGIAQTNDSTYTLTIPEFSVIGQSEPDFEVAVEDNGLLSWGTADVNELHTVNEVLNADELADYIASNRDILEDQTEFFYGNIIRSVDPTMEVNFVFEGQ